MEQRFLAAAARGDALHHFDITDLGVMEQGAEAVVAALFREAMRAGTDEDFGTPARYRECSLRLQDLYSAYAGTGRFAFTPWPTLRQYRELQRSCGAMQCGLDFFAATILMCMHASGQTDLATTFEGVSPLLFALQHRFCATSTLLAGTCVLHPGEAEAGMAAMIACTPHAIHVLVSNYRHSKPLCFGETLPANTRLPGTGGTALHGVCRNTELTLSRLSKCVQALVEYGVGAHILDDDLRSPVDILRARPDRDRLGVLIALLDALRQEGVDGDWRYAETLRLNVLPDIAERIAKCLHVAN
jgi:hypothetical protein